MLSLEYASDVKTAVEMGNVLMAAGVFTVAAGVGAGDKTGSSGVCFRNDGTYYRFDLSSVLMRTVITDQLQRQVSHRFLTQASTPPHLLARPSAALRACPC